MAAQRDMKKVITLWEKVKKSVVDGVTAAAGKTEEYTKRGKAKLDVLAVKRKISKQFAELGGIIYDAVKAKNVNEVLDSHEGKKLIDSLKDLEKELEEKEDAFEELKKITESEEKKKK